MKWFNKQPQLPALPRDISDWEPINTFPTEYELDALGARLDWARKALSQTKENTWARTYWTNTVGSLTRRWKRLMIECNAGVLRSRVPESWTIQNDWFETDASGVTFGILWHWYSDHAGRYELEKGLETSWAKAQEERYQKALTNFV